MFLYYSGTSALVEIYLSELYMEIRRDLEEGVLRLSYLFKFKNRSVTIREIASPKKRSICFWSLRYFVRTIEIFL